MILQHCEQWYIVHNGIISIGSLMNSSTQLTCQWWQTLTMFDDCYVGNYEFNHSAIVIIALLTM